MPRFSGARLGKALRRLAAVWATVAALAHPAAASTVTITFTERQTDVLVSYAGQVDVLTFPDPLQSQIPIDPRIEPSSGELYFGTFAADFDRFFLTATPAPFGSGGRSAIGSMQTGDAFRVQLRAADLIELSLPQNYVSNTPLSGSMVFAGSFLSLGIDATTTAFVSLPGSQQIRYVFEPYTAAIPVPATLPLLASALGMILVRRRRRS